MTADLAVKVHEIASDGLPDMDALVGRVAFIFDGCVVSGWPLNPDDPDLAHVYAAAGQDIESQVLWEADSDVGHGRPFGGVTHWIEFPTPLHEIAS